MSKKELFLVGVSLMCGMVIGYNKAREKFLEAMLKGYIENEIKKEKEKSES